MEFNKIALDCLKLLSKFFLAGSVIGVVLGGSIVGLGQTPPEATPATMIAASWLVLATCGLLLGQLLLALKGAWFMLKLVRGRASLPDRSTMVISSAVGSLTTGAASGVGAAVWVVREVYPTNKEWGPFLAAVEAPIAFLLAGGTGLMVGAMLGLLVGFLIVRARTGS